MKAPESSVMHAYEHLGLSIRSEIDLQLPAASSDDGAADLTFRWAHEHAVTTAPPDGEVVASAGVADDWWYVLAEAAEGYVVRFNSCGEFAISADLSTIEVRRDPDGVRTHLIPVLAAGTVMAMVMTLRGETLLHASAVAIDGQAIAFVGQSGRGKSTVAALMCNAGAQLVTDDVLVVHGGEPAMCIGGASELRLRPNAASIAGDAEHARTRQTPDERTGFLPEAAATQRLPLAAIVMPSPDREIDAVEIQRLPPAAAMFALLSFPRVFGWRRDDEATRDFAVLRDVLAVVPMYAASIPWGPPFDPDVPQVLARLADRHDDPDTESA